MNVRLCFSHEEAFTVPLAPYPPDHHTTLCGKRAFLASLTRRKITCEECVRLKPKRMGGATTTFSGS